jgi:hypothetical protein
MEREEIAGLGASLGSDAAASPIFGPVLNAHLPAGEINPTYEKKVPCASGSANLSDSAPRSSRNRPGRLTDRRMEAGGEASWCLNELPRQNGLTTARITMPIIKTVGISLIMR